MSDSIKAWLDAAGRFPVMSKTEFAEAIKQRDQYEPGSKQYLRVINRICERNLRLVHKVADRYMRLRAMPHLRDYAPDMLQHGYLGLRRAAEKYDITRGFAFSTYAMPWIKQAITRGTFRAEHVVYVPESLHSELLYVKKHGHRSSSKNGRATQATLDMASHAMNVSSIDVRISDDDTASLADIMSDENKVRNEHSEFTNRTKEVHDLLVRTGTSERDIDVIMKFLAHGRVEGARRANLSVTHARLIYDRTISRIKASLA